VTIVQVGEEPLHPPFPAHDVVDQVDSVSLREVSDRMRALERRVAELEARAGGDARTVADEARREALTAGLLATELTRRLAELEARLNARQESAR
jgi:BMFP domain-containing protein YqiC